MKGIFFCLNICSIDFQLVHWKEQNIFSGGKTSAHKPAQLTKVVLERVSLTRAAASHGIEHNANVRQKCRLRRTALSFGGPKTVTLMQR